MTERMSREQSCVVPKKIKPSTGGYYRLVRRVNGKKVGILLHRLVFEQTYGPIPKGLFVCHSCDNPGCVNPEHLFLGTAKDNYEDSRSKGRNNRPRGQANHFAKLTEADVVQIRHRHKRGASYRDLARHYRISESNISLIVRGKGWVGIDE